jgi:hypothetical protein
MHYQVNDLIMSNTPIELLKKHLTFYSTMQHTDLFDYIGYYHQMPKFRVNSFTDITEDEAEVLLLNDLRKCESWGGYICLQVQRDIPDNLLNQNQLDALIAYCFIVGDHNSHSMESKFSRKSPSGYISKKQLDALFHGIYDLPKINESKEVSPYARHIIIQKIDEIIPNKVLTVYLQDGMVSSDSIEKSGDFWIYRISHVLSDIAELYFTEWENKFVPIQTQNPYALPNFSNNSFNESSMNDVKWVEFELNRYIAYRQVTGIADSVFYHRVRDYQRMVGLSESNGITQDTVIDLISRM